MSEVEKKPEVEENKAEEEDHSSSDEHEHVHDQNCDHGHDDKKGGRGEKKFKKAMGKMGLKPVTGINRVTIKKGKAVHIYFIFSSLSVLMIQMCGNHPEPKAHMLFSENQILTVWELDKTK